MLLMIRLILSVWGAVTIYVLVHVLATEIVFLFQSIG